MEGLKSRAVPLIVCIALVLVGWFGGNALQNGDQKLITTQVTGLKANTAVMEIDGEEITAGEYLYWLATVCDSLYVDYGIQDWSMMLGDVSINDYVKSEAEYYATRNVIVDKLAREQGITVNEEQQKLLDDMDSHWIAYYGGEDMYEYMLTCSGMTREMLIENNTVPFLFSNLADSLLAEGGELEPNEERLQAFAERNQLDISDEELLKLYVDPSYGAVNEYINNYVNQCETVKKPAYDTIDVAVFYPALNAAREAVAIPEAEEQASNQG